MSTRKVERPENKITQGVTYPEDFSLFKETIKGLPKAAKETGQDIARGLTILPGMAASGYMSLAESAKKREPTFVQPKFNVNEPAIKFGPGQKLARAVFGEEEFTPYGEVVKFQDVFRSDTKQGQFKAGTPLVGLGLAAADLPTSGGASRLVTSLTKALRGSKQASKAAESFDDAAAVLRKNGISDDVINTFDLGNRVARTTDDTELDTIFREAAQAESTFRSTGKVPIRRQINRPTVGAMDITAPRRVAPEQSTQTASVAARTAPETLQPQAVRRAQRQDILDKADEARLISEEVMPQTDVPMEEIIRQRGTGTAIETSTPFDGKPVFNVTIDDLIRTDIQGESTLDPQTVAENVARLKRGERLEPIRVQVADGALYIEDGKHRVAALLEAGEETVDAIQIPTQRGASIRRANDGAIPQTRPLQKANPDTVIEQAAKKYESAKNIGLGDTAMARLAQRAPSLNGLELASDLLTPISSRLGRINPKLKFKVRNLEIETRRLTTERLNAVLPLMKATKKMNPTDRVTFDLALKNGDSQTISAFAQKYGIQNEIDQARKMLDDVFKEAEEVGLEVSYRGDFFPRQVKNPEAFSQYLRGRDDWGSIRKQLEEKAEQQGKRFTDLTNEEIAGMTNNILRGYGSQVTLAKPGQIKARKIEELGTELNRFYENSNTALLTYVHKMTDEIEGRKFFGKASDKTAVTKNPLTGEVAVFNTDDSIGAYVTRLIADGEITPRQQDEVTKILQARFKKGGMNGLVSAYRDLEYISTMGNPISAVTQIGDLAFSLYKNGWWNSLRAVGKTVTRRTELTKESLGIERIAQEFDNPAKTSKALERVFKMVGMEQIDRLGKETFLESSRLKLKTLANKKDDQLLTDLNYMFDEVDAIRALEELKSGDITVRTKEVIMNRLMDIQPIAKSEMPVKYLEMPNGRVFYMLKSFTIKQFDIFRREAIDKIISGNRKQKAEGIKNLVYLSSVFMLANATADEIKDMMLGRETEPSDRLVDNIFRLFGASKYDVYNSRERGIGFAVLQRLLPPASVIDRLSTDVSRLAEEKRYKTGPLEGERYGSEAVQSIPGGGKLYYWWFGRGAQKEIYSNESSVSDTSSRVRTVTRPGQGEDSSSGRVRKVERP